MRVLFISQRQPVWSAICLLLCLTYSPFLLAFDHDHSLWSKSLARFVDQEGWVDYANWQKDRTDLATYSQQLEAVKYSEYESWQAGEKKAYLINAYNAYTVKLILDHYPLKGIRSIGGFFRNPWKREFFSILDGKLKTLDAIEHDWLRKKPELQDPRVHAVVNCASVSCPKLFNQAFVASKLDEQMTQATKEWLADKTRNQYDGEQKLAKLSKIFDWYKEDFGGDHEGIAKFVRQYGPDAATKALQTPFRIEYLDYDWNLNQKP